MDDDEKSVVIADGLCGLSREEAQKVRDTLHSEGWGLICGRLIKSLKSV